MDRHCSVGYRRTQIIFGIIIIIIYHDNLGRSEFDPELFPHSAYVMFFVTFATKLQYLTFCDKM